MSVDLKPCPFCGGEAELNELIYRQKHMYAVTCTDLYCRVSALRTINNYKSKEEAIKAWEKRVTE